MDKSQWEASKQELETKHSEGSTSRKHDFLVRKGREVVRAANTLYVDLDVEADGKPGYGSLLSIGAVTPTGREFYRELKPSSDLYVPSMKRFCDEHGLQRERLIEEGVSAEEAIYDLDVWIAEESQVSDRPAALAAFNASFDYAWIDLEMIRAGIPKNPFGVAGYCLKSLAMSLGLLRPSVSYEWADTRKSSLPPEITPAAQFTHNALADAKWQQEQHFAMVGLINPDKQIKTRRYYNLYCNEEAQLRSELPMYDYESYYDIH